MTQTTIAIGSDVARPGRSLVERLSRRRARRRGRVAVTLAVGFLTLIVLVAIIGPWVVDLPKQDFATTFAGPSREHWLGTDDLGRDQLIRLIHGTRASIGGATIALGVALIIGVPTGLIAGYARGALDLVLSRFNDGLLGMPALLLALSLVAVVGAGLWQSMAVIGLIFSPLFFRLTRAATLSVKQRTFVEAFNALGFGPFHIVVRHVLPNILVPLSVQAAITAGLAIHAEASLSFLGLGVQPPHPSWGSMMSGAFQSIFSGQHLIYPPGILIALTVLAFSTLGDWLRDELQPQREAVTED